MPPAIIGLGLSFLHLHHAEGPYPLIIAPQDPLRDPPYDVHCACFGLLVALMPAAFWLRCWNYLCCYVAAARSLLN